MFPRSWRDKSPTGICTGTAYSWIRAFMTKDLLDPAVDALA